MTKSNDKLILQMFIMKIQNKIQKSKNNQNGYLLGFLVEMRKCVDKNGLLYICKFSFLP